MQKGIRKRFQEHLLAFGVSVLALFAVSPTPAVADYYVGSTSANLEVDSQGQIGFKTPIVVPPGIQGLVPKVAVQYSSGGGNGYLGLGGQLSGLSSVTRCGKTEADDGAFRGVNLDHEDRFCIGGQRMVLVSGQHGQMGAIYRTKIDTFQRISITSTVPYPDGSNGPGSFLAENKGGGETIYGATANSRVTSPETGVVHSWKLSSLADVFGNTVNYSYAEFDATGGHGETEIERPIQSIVYGGNQSQSLAHHLGLEFEYENRPDESHIFNNGIGFKQTQRLKKIRTIADGGDVRNYHIDYDVSPVSHQSRITSVQECAGTSTADSHCKPPTVFSWKTPNQDWENDYTWTPPANLYDQNGQPNGVLIDMDFDGRTDFVAAVEQADGSRWMQTWLNGDSGWVMDSLFSPPAPLGKNGTDANGMPLQASMGEAADLNGDGRVDWIESWSDGVSTVNSAWINTPTGFVLDDSYQLPVVLTEDIGSTNPVKTAQLVDINGDGLVDVVAATRRPDGSQISGIWLNNRTGWAALASFTLPGNVFDYSVNGASEETQTGQLADINGDGLADWIQSYRDSNGMDHLDAWVGTGTGWTRQSDMTPPIAIVDYQVNPSGKRLGELTDINGDGLPDLVQATQTGNATTHAAWLNTGKGWVLSPDFTPPSFIIKYENGQPRNYGAFIDVTADGLPDLVHAYQDSSGSETHRVWRNTSEGWEVDNRYILPGPLALHPVSGSNAPDRVASTLVDVNADGVSDLISAGPTESYSYLQRLGENTYALPEHIGQSVDGYGMVYQAFLQPGHIDNTYVPGALATFPQVDVPAIGAVVVKLEASDGVGGIANSYYRYGGLKTDVQGRGSVGFAWREIEDGRNGIVLRSEYEQEYPFGGMLRRTIKYIDDVQHVESTHTNAFIEPVPGKTWYPYLNSKSTISTDLDGTWINTVGKSTTLDGFGNPIQTESITNDITGEYRKVIDKEFDNDVSTWVLGKETRVTKTNYAPGTQSVTRVIETIPGQNGQPLSVTQDPDTPQWLKTSYQYDGFGNTTSTTVQAQAQPDRVTAVEYSTDGRFPVLARNSLGHEATKQYDGRFGHTTVKSDPNGVTKETIYDFFGQKVNEISVMDNAPEDSQTVVEKLWCAGNQTCPENALFLVRAADNQGNAPESVYYDMMVREVRKQSMGFSGESVFTDIDYDAYGRKVRESQPYFDGSTPHYMETQYDLLGRKSIVTAPDASKTTFSYSGLAHSVVNARNQRKTTRLNGHGKPAEVIDERGNSVTYTYDARGLLLTTSHGNTTTISNSYNLLGQKVAMDDPDMGVWTYEYDVYGNLIRQTDAKDQVTLTNYDALNRKTSQTTDAGGSNENLLTWEYDSAINGIGKLSTVTGSDHGNAGTTLPGGQSTYQRSHAYDALGRLTESTVAIDGESFLTRTLYRGSTEEVDGIEYPNGLLVRTTFNEYGFAEEVRSGGLADYQLYLDQQEEANQKTQAAIDLENSLRGARNNHVAAYNQRVQAAEPLAAESQRLSRAAQDEMRVYNRYYSNVRRYESKINSLVSRARKLESDLNKAYQDFQIARNTYCGDFQRGDGPDSPVRVCERSRSDAISSAQAKMEKIQSDAKALESQNITLVNSRQSAINKMNHHAARANSYASSANQYAQQASAQYTLANQEAAAINRIDQRVRRKVREAKAAQKRVETLHDDYLGNSVLQWAAQDAAADGQVLKFNQGNGVTTEVGYNPQTRRLNHLKAVVDSESEGVFGQDDVSSLITKLEELVADLQSGALNYQAELDRVSTSHAAAEQNIQSLTDDITEHQANGEEALAIALQAELQRNQLDRDILSSEISLNQGLLDIFSGNHQSALVLQSAYGDADSIREGRQLEKAYHALLARHYAEIKTLYENLSQTQQPLVAEYGTLEIPNNLDLFHELAVSQTDIASHNEARYQLLLQQADSGDPASSSLIQQVNKGWSSHAAAFLYEKRAELYDDMANLVDKVLAQSRLENVGLSELYSEDDQPVVAAFFTSRATMGQERVDQYRLMADAMRSRLQPLRDQAIALDEEAPAQSILSQYQYLADANRGLADQYTLMSGETFWTDLYAGFESELTGVTENYDAFSAEYALLADQHESQSADAEIALENMQLLGDDGEVLDVSYQFDSIGNLKRRSDSAVGLNETFTYDSLNRLVKSEMDGRAAELYQMVGLDVVDIHYAEDGNMLYRSDVGSYTYGEGNAGVHAVTSITGTKNTSYNYDANGNMLSGDGREITVGVHNKPVRIVKGATTMDMFYGPEGQLYKRTEPGEVGGSKTTVWVGGVYEKVTEGSVAEHKYHIPVRGGIVAVISHKEGGLPSTHYLHRDHLNSIAAISDEGGNVLQRFHYDAFGQRRVALKTNDEGSLYLENALTDRGYTGHKTLAKLDLVHMNGRVYDPTIGRFLSADPHIQAPDNLQSFNRYSYVWNNPLSFIDPSGYFLKDIGNFIGNFIKGIAKSIKIAIKAVGQALKKVVEVAGVVAVVVIAVVAPYAVAAVSGAGVTASTLTFGGKIAAGALAGGLTGYATTGSLKGLLVGAVSGAALAGIGHGYANNTGIFNGVKGAAKIATKAGLHGIVGGLRTTLMGGKFKDGFVSSAFTAVSSETVLNKIDDSSIGGRLESTMAAGIIGGLGAELAGGQFADGFVNGAMSHGLNSLINAEDGPSAQKGRDIRRGQYNTQKLDSTETIETYGEWRTEGALGDFVATGMSMASKHLYVQGAAAGLDAIDAFNFQHRTVNVQQVNTYRTYTHDVLYEISANGVWTVLPRTIGPGVATKFTHTNIVNESSYQETRYCTFSNYGCSGG